MILHFDKISNDKIEKYLEENYGLKINSEIMIDAFQGSIGKAISLKEKQEEYQKIEEIIYNLEKRDIVDIINMSEILYKSKDEITDMLDYMNIVFINLARTSNKYVNCIEVVEDTKKRLKSNANYDMSIDNMMFKLSFIAKRVIYSLCN